ncbi:conjugal transfer protein TraO [Chryseobacterium sp. IHB B 17019]|uniref:conjugal transfer protein TraO n=1 Tax=Chryseobacterium sp. IHB B 17019 TaxID=1721091 RepID=UPI000721D98C|nr:conjugal transfer protein TraO [Chryseobacterium sp. IHB B 17019]ALR29240.1 conjugal transfer protein TraO [Chryseobacterium sp. IHB B 17019]
MTKYIFTALFSVVFTTSIYAQRLLKGQKGFEATIGLISDKKPVHDYFYAQVGMTVNGKKGGYHFFSLEYSYKKHEFQKYAIPVESYVAETGYSFVLLGDWTKVVSLNIGLSALVGYEVINRGESTLPNGAMIQNKDSFIYGGGVRLSLETFITDHVLLLLQGRTKAVWGTSLERIRPSAGVGVRYIF